MFEGNSLLNLSKKYSNFAARRTATIAENIANIDSPDFTAKDVSFAPKNQIAMPQFKSTRTQHINPVNMNGSANTRDYVETQIRDRPVSLEEQIFNSFDSQRQFDTSTNIYRTAINLYRVALGAGR